MTTISDPLQEHIRPAGAGIRGRIGRVSRFLLHLLEMAIPMVLGMVGFGLLADQLQAFPRFGAAFQSDTDLYILGDGLFMSLPMVAWMVVRRHGWRHSLEMGASMILPGLAIVMLGWLGLDSSAPGLRENACGWMCLGMPVYMLVRYHHFSAKPAHAVAAPNLNWR